MAHSICAILLVAGACTVAAPALAKECYAPDARSQERAFSRAVTTEGGKTVWLGGQTGSPEKNFEGQVRDIFAELDKTIKAVGGAGLQDLVTIVFLPAFFAFTGMRTQVGLLSSPFDWIICAAIIVAATAGKFGGTLFASRVAGMSWTRSTALGILMNTRGLMELIVLNAGLYLGVISPKLFTMMVLMAVVTTVMTTPVLHLLRVVPSLAPVGESRVGRLGTFANR